MNLAFALPDTVWGSIAGAFLGGLVASAVVAYWTQRWIERRERRNRRDDLRLELYLDVLDLVLTNEAALAARTTEGGFAPLEIQSRRLRVSHRLRLLGTARVHEAYCAYRDLVYEETANPLEDRPKDGDAVVRTRDALIEAMAEDIQSV